MCGGKFERAVGNALKSQGFEVLSGVHPGGIENQIDIDLVFRFRDKFGIAEIKLGGLGGEANPKRGMEQLAMAGAREYLGVYTHKFYIVANPNALKSLRMLARKRNIHLIAIPEYSETDLSAQKSKELADLILKCMS